MKMLVRDAVQCQRAPVMLEKTKEEGRKDRYRGNLEV